MAPETLIVEEHDHITKITLNRPNALNAINDKMGEELLATLKDTEKSETARCLVITGAGRAFSAGEDVAGLKDRYGEGAHPPLGDHLRKKYHPIITRIRNIEKPIIARLNGIAAGSGASLALACDIRVASEEAGLKQAFIGVGLVPDSGSSYFLTRMIGIGRALELIMTEKQYRPKKPNSSDSSPKSSRPPNLTSIRTSSPIGSRPAQLKHWDYLSESSTESQASNFPKLSSTKRTTKTSRDEPATI